MSDGNRVAELEADGWSARNALVNIIEHPEATHAVHAAVARAALADPSPSQRRIEAAVALADAALESDDLDKEAWASVSDTGTLSERNRRAEDHQRRLHVNSARLTTARDAYRAALAAEKGDAT